MNNILAPKQIYLLIGEYKHSLKHLFNKMSNLLIPKVLWIDYQIIQLPEFISLFKMQIFNTSNFFFINIYSEEILNQMIKSGILQKAKNYGFLTICINMFHYYHILPEVEFFLSKLSEIYIIILLTRTKSLEILNSTIINVPGD